LPDFSCYNIGTKTGKKYTKYRENIPNCHKNAKLP
jgi:hypothetical protein